MIKLELSGNFVERFINICRHHKIYFKEIHFHNNKYIAIIYAKDFFRLKEYNKETKVHIKIIEKTGFIFWYKNNAGRYAFVLGLIIFAGIMMFLSKFIWRIEINGNFHYPTEEISEYLEIEGIHKGSKISMISEDELESKIRKNFDDIIWVSVSIEGTKLTIDVKENNTVNSKADKAIPRDIVAAKDGIIKSIYVRNGTAIVKPGDVVKAGDILITSKVTCMNESNEEKKIIYSSADGDVIIEAELDYYDEIQRNYEERIYTGNEIQQRILKIGDRIITGPAFKCKYDKYDVVIDYANPFSGKFVYCYKYYREYKICPRNYTDMDMNRILEENLAKYVTNLEENSIQIIENSVKIDVVGLKGYAQGKIKIYDSAIAYQEPIIINEEVATE